MSDTPSPSFPSPPSGVVGLTLKPGDKVQHFVVVQQIGAGGTSAVFKAHDALLNRHVAIKQVLLAPGEEGDAYRARVLAEAATHKRAAAADPTMLVQLMDVVADPRGVLLVMEYVDGPSLEQILATNTAPMDERQALGIIAGAAKGLASLHEAGVLHRDLKPANILMPRSGGLRLADFGLSVAAGGQQTMDQGSVRYLAPEILQGQPATPASDLYALGMIAYETMAGRAQFEEAFKAILRDQRNQSMRWVKWHTNPRIKAMPLAQLCPGLSPAIIELIERLMDKDPLRRIASAADLLEAIRRIFMAQSSAHTDGLPPANQMMQGQAEGAFPSAPAGATARIPKRRKWPVVAASAGLVLLLAAGVFTFMPPKKPADPLVLKDRRHAIQLMHDAEAAWKENDYVHALELFSDMQDGGREYRKPGSTSRLFADAGAAKCRVVLAQKKQDYLAALTALEDFRKSVAALEARGPFPTLEVGLGEPQKELAERLTKELEPHRYAAEIIAKMHTLLEQGKTSECLAEGRALTNREGVLSPVEKADVNALMAQCSKSKQELRLERLLAKAQRKADEGDTRGALEDLKDQAKLDGEQVDLRVVAAIAAIENKARLDSLISQYEKADTKPEKIAALLAVLKINPDYPDKSKLPRMRADQDLEDAQRAFQDNDLARADQLITAGLKQVPTHIELMALRRTITRLMSDKGLVDQAEALYARKDYAAAITAYEKITAQISDTTVTDAARARIQSCNGQLKKAEGLDLLGKGDLIRAEIALQSAQKMLGAEDTDITAAVQRIADLHSYRSLRQIADASLARKNYATAVLQYVKTLEFLKAHEGLGDNEDVADRLRLCRFESKMLQFQEAMDRMELNSASGYISAADNYAKLAEEKARVKQAQGALAAELKKQH